MSSAVITALLVSVMLLIIASFVVGALQAHRCHKRSLTIAPQRPTDQLDVHMSMMVRMQEGVVVGIEQLQSLSTFTLPSSWYSRRRTLVSIGFLIMVFLTLFVQSGLADGALKDLNQSFSLLSNFQTQDIHASNHPLSLTASTRIVRVDSAARNQYYTDYQWQVWSYASCSGIAMEEVMNAYGRHLMAADVLQIELDMGVWDTYNGLIAGEPGIARVANYFGFKADPQPPRTLDALISVTNKGFPVIVGIPGHILVVRGGDNNYVYLVDSAPANRTSMTRADFLSLWANFSVLLTPQT
jgi:hypothetical protein